MALGRWPKVSGISVIAAGLLALGGCAATQPHTRMLTYEPAVVELEGVVQREPAGAIILVLDQPVDVAASTAFDSPDAAEQNQCEVAREG